MRRRFASAALAALVVAGLAGGAHGDPIGMGPRIHATPAGGATTNGEAEPLDLQLTAEARGASTEGLLQHGLAQLRCAAFQQMFDEEPGRGPAASEDVLSGSERATPFQPPPPPEVYRSGVDPERLRSLAAEIAGTDRSGALDGSRANVEGLPPRLAVSGWGSLGAPLIAYIPRAETPFDLKRDMSGAGALVVDGDLRIWSSFRYAGLLVVLGDLAVMEDAELSLRGLPLFAGELEVFYRGRLRVTARETEIALIRKTFAGRVARLRLPLPQIERVEGPGDEEDCAFYGTGM